MSLRSSESIAPGGSEAPSIGQTCGLRHASCLMTTNCRRPGRKNHRRQCPDRTQRR